MDNFVSVLGRKKIFRTLFGMKTHISEIIVTVLVIFWLVCFIKCSNIFYNLYMKVNLIFKMSTSLV
jgi:hypothetical protein